MNRPACISASIATLGKDQRQLIWRIEVEIEKSNHVGQVLEFKRVLDIRSILNRTVVIRDFVIRYSPVSGLAASAAS
jgi:hypothetical protein